MSIDYINGYLAGVAAQREAHDQYISYDYTLATIDKQGKTVSETVKHKVVTTIEQFLLLTGRGTMTGRSTST